MNIWRFCMHYRINKLSCNYYFPFRKYKNRVALWFRVRCVSAFWMPYLRPALSAMIGFTRWPPPRTQPWLNHAWWRGLLGRRARKGRWKGWPENLPMQIYSVYGAHWFPPWNIYFIPTNNKFIWSSCELSCWTNDYRQNKVACPQFFYLRQKLE